MGKVTLKPLAAPDSPIYNQPLMVGARFTKSSPTHPLDGLDLQNLAVDPAQAAMELVLGKGSKRRK